MKNTKEKTKDQVIQEMIDEQWASTMSTKNNLTYGDIQQLDNLFTINEGKYTYR
jgi:hypothetical protein